MWLGASITVGVSTVTGGVAYALWMLAAIPAARSENIYLIAATWILAPIVTAAGFAAGVFVSERKLRGSKPEFRRILIWPLIGCTLGAVSTYLLGPMLIVFGMLTAGVISVTLREVFLFFKQSR
jgi:hypothetical protein